MKIKKLLSFLIIAIWMMSANNASAIITIGSGDPDNNTTPPKEARKFWDEMLVFGRYIGTPIAPRYFIEAAHVGRISNTVISIDEKHKIKPLGGERSHVGQEFKFKGNVYNIISEHLNPNGKDFVIYEVDRDFPSWVALNTDTNEIGMEFLDFGRGLQRGGEVWGPGLKTIYTTNVVDLKEVAQTEGMPLGDIKQTYKELFSDAVFQGDTMTTVREEVVVADVLKGWRFGARDGRVRWGKNKVDSILTFGNYEFLTATFDADQGPDEAYIAFGDSGGPLIVEKNGVWTLIGINYGIDAVPATEPNGPFFFGAIYDISGLWNGTYQYPLDIHRPLRFYSSRISTQIDWILSVVN